MRSKVNAENVRDVRENADMEENVPERLKKLRAHSGLSLSELATKARFKGASSIQRYFDPTMFTKKYLGFDVAERFADALANMGDPPITRGEVLALAGPAAMWAHEQHGMPTTTPAIPVETHGLRDLPVYSSAEGGKEGMIVIPEAIDWIARPHTVLSVQDSFAIYVVGDSMEPRIEHGELVVVDPSRPIRRNDDVVFIKVLSDETWLALVKRLVRWTEKQWIVKQYNPSKEFKIARSDWVKAYVIVSRTVL